MLLASLVDVVYLLVTMDDAGSTVPTLLLTSSHIYSTPSILSYVLVGRGTLKRLWGVGE